MKLRKLQIWAAMLAAVGTCLPTAAWSADAPRAAASGVDVALGDGGLFVGQVVDAQGAKIAKAEVSIRYDGKEVVRTATDDNGVFAAKGLRGGQYDVVAADHSAPVRLWAPDTAPPSARTAALIITGGDVVNGQHGRPGGILAWMQAHPLIVAGVVVAAVATPIAIAAADDDDDSHS
jgi:hypothetical protein